MAHIRAAVPHGLLRSLAFGKPSRRPHTTIYLCSAVRRVHALNPKTGVQTQLEPEAEPYEWAAREREVDIRTCGDLFSKWRVQSKYWRVPDGDVHFRVRYIDTGHERHNSRESPVVLALHGSPGSYRDFSLISSHLHGLDVRVISPLFPDCHTYKMGRFRHTPEEKSEYVKDFLKAISIPRVDLLMCHSSALFPGLLLCLEDPHVSVNSLCLLNPTAFDYPRVLNPFWMTRFLCRLFEFPVGYHITEAVGKIVLKFKSELKGGDYLAQFLAAFTMHHSAIPQRMHVFEKLLEQNFPVLLAYSENDKLIARSSLDTMAGKMLEESAFQRYDRFGKLDRAGAANPFRKVLVFENGTHFLYKKYPDIVSETVSSFLFQHFDNHRL